MGYNTLPIIVPKQIVSFWCNQKWSFYNLSLFVIIISSSILKLRYLGHTALHSVDECCHALVAKNLLKHPFKPTLIDIPYLPTSVVDWGTNHVWLHKPVLGMWQIAGSYWLFGVSTWSLRFPSVILSAAAVWLTYLIGKELLSRQAGFIAATIQAFSPFMMRLIHGYQFSDAIDISLLFWTEFAIYFLIRAMHTGRSWHIVLAGFGQGCAFLSKSYLALIVTGLAITAWIAPMLGMGRSDQHQIRGRYILDMTGAFLLTALPWTLWIAIRFPAEFQHEHLYIWLHLTSNIEKWGAPWHKVILDYGPMMYGVFYVPVCIAVLILFVKLFSEENIGLTLTYAWGFGVLIPHLLAATKTPSATLIGMPAFLLVFGEVVYRCLLWLQRRETLLFRVMIIIVVLNLLVLGIFTIRRTWQITSLNQNTPTFAEIATYAETQLPHNAVFLVELDANEPQNIDEHLRLMFLISKTAHRFIGSTLDVWKEKAAEVRKTGGIPYLVSSGEWSLHPVFISLTDKRTIYSDEIP